jgi:uncharacterized protein
MKINVTQIPSEGVVLQETIPYSELDLETEVVKFSGPLKVKARVTRITNALTVDLSIVGLMAMTCSRCLVEFTVDFKKDLRLSYPVNKEELYIELNQDIREEILLDYPIKPLCTPGCRGLCPLCGKNKNEGGCSCAITKKKTF